MKHQRFGPSGPRDRTQVDAAIPAKCNNSWWIVPGVSSKAVPPNHPGAVEISCGKCLRCAITRRNQIVGRMLAGQQTCLTAVFVTLTYGPAPDGSIPTAAQWCPVDGIPEAACDDWVLFRKRMWKRHGQAQYCGAAEVGELKRRVHFHAAFMFESSVSRFCDADVAAILEAKKLTPTQRLTRCASWVREAAERVPESELATYPGDKRKLVPEWIKLPDAIDRAYRFARQTGGLDELGRFECCGVLCKSQHSVKDGSERFIAWLPEWPHGYVNVGQMNGQSAGYIAKYMMDVRKSAVLRGENSIHNSKATKAFVSQQLGYEYMRRLGADCARQGAEPVGRFTIPGQKVASGPGAGTSRQYTMTRGMRRELCEGHMREIARQLATGERAEWRARDVGRGHVVADWIEQDARNDPRTALETFFRRLYAVSDVGLSQASFVERRAATGVPYLDPGQTCRVVSCPDGGVVAKNTRGEYLFSWPDLSGNGRDVRIPIANRGELRRAVRYGGVSAFGLHPPSSVICETAKRACDFGRSEPIPGEVSGPAGRIVRRRVLQLGERVEKRRKLRAVDPYAVKPVYLPAGDLPANTPLEKLPPELVEDVRVPVLGDQVWRLRQVLELNGRGVSSPESRAEYAAVGKGSLAIRETRAWVTAAQLDEIRSRVVRLQIARWQWPARIKGKFGLPSYWVGSSLTPDDIERYPKFAKWFQEACPNAPPF